MLFVRQLQIAIVANLHACMRSRKSRPRGTCPLDGNCLTKSIVYKAEITTTDVGETKEYIGMTAGTFKARYANHKKSINSPRYSNETELSKYAWKLKQSNRPYTIKWSVLSHASPYIRRRCKFLQPLLRGEVLFNEIAQR